MNLLNTRNNESQNQYEFYKPYSQLLSHYFTLDNRYRNLQENMKPIERQKADKKDKIIEKLKEELKENHKKVSEVNELLIIK